MSDTKKCTCAFPCGQTEPACPSSSTGHQDSRVLLKRYMAKVIDCESITFVDIYSHDIDLTPDEVQQLHEIEAEVRKEYNL